MKIKCFLIFLVLGGTVFTMSNCKKKPRNR